MLRSHSSLLIGSVLLLVGLSGCSQRPSRISPPSISAGKASQAAMDLFDTDGDGYLAGGELDAAPSLKGSLAIVDSNDDKKIEASEIAARIKAWKESRVGLTSFAVTVTMDGRPLPGAEVVFEPSAFLGGAIQQALGTTNRRGQMSPSIPKELRPTADAPGGVQYGFYNIRVSLKKNGTEMVPARYNEATTLGTEVSGANPEIADMNVRVELKSK